MKGCSSAVLLNPPPSSTLIHIRSTTVSEWRDALVQCFSTPPPLLYTDSYQIFHCVWMKGCSSAVLLNPPPSSTLILIRSFTVSEWRDALVQCFSTPPSSTLIHIRSFTVSEWRDALVQCFSTPPPSSTLIHIRSSTVSEWRDALVQCFSTPPPPPLHWFLSDLSLCLNEGML